MRYDIETCVRNILAMVPWQAGDEPGRFVPGDAVEKGPGGSRSEYTPEIALPEEAIASIRDMRPTPEEVARRGEEDNMGEDVPLAAATDNWLGRYSPMSPTGLIQLHRPRLGSFFRHLILPLHQKHQITAYQLCRLAEATVAKTFVHEAFHHRSDLLRLMFGTRLRDPLVEEALAVAASRHIVEKHGGSAFCEWEVLPLKLRDDFLNTAYHFTAAGYRDWRNYQNSAFEEGLFRHVVHESVLRTLRAGARADYCPSIMMHWHWHHFFDASSTDVFADSDLVEVRVVPEESSPHEGL